MHHSTHTIRTDRSARLVGVAVAGLASIGTFALAAPAAHADDEVSEEILVIGTKDDTGGDTGTSTGGGDSGGASSTESSSES